MLPSYNKQNKGFTMLEIVIVIIIVGILSTLAIPRFTSTVERVRAAEGVQMLTALLGAQKAFQLENAGNYSTDPDLLDIEIAIASNFDVPPTVLNPGDPVANPIARIRRTAAYWLEINENGVIDCVDAGVTFTCAQAGY